MVKIKKVVRKWYSPDEKNLEAIKFYIEGRKGHILLAEDRRVRRMWNVHFMNYEDLNDCEKDKLALSVIEFLKPEDYLGVSGDYVERSEIEYRKFSWRTAYFLDTGMTRTLKNNIFSINFPILKRI